MKLSKAKAILLDIFKEYDGTIGAGKLYLTATSKDKLGCWSDAIYKLYTQAVASLIEEGKIAKTNVIQKWVQEEESLRIVATYEPTEQSLRPFVFDPEVFTIMEGYTLC